MVLTGDTALLLACAEAGMGVAVICGPPGEVMEHTRRLTVFEGSGMFEDSRAWLAVRRGKVLRNFEAQFCRGLLPEIDLESFQREILSRNAREWEPEFAI